MFTYVYTYISDVHRHVHDVYVTRHILTYFTRKRQMILMKEMSWKLLFTLQEITVCVLLLALETAFGIKEPVAG